MPDRVVSLRVRGLRTLADISLKLDGITVVIGDNGAGKSSLIEACALLARTARPGFLDSFYDVHGGLNALLRHGEREMTIGARIESTDGSEPALEYAVTLSKSGRGGAFIESESLEREILTEHAGPGGSYILQRNRTQSLYYEQAAQGLTPADTAGDRLMLPMFVQRPAPHPALRRMVAALDRFDVHLPVDALPTWVAREVGRDSPLRRSAELRPVERLTIQAQNLANAYFKLKSETGGEHWRQTLEYVRLGLGQDIDDVILRADPAGSAIALLLAHKTLAEPVSARALSDGTLAWLAFVAMYRLSKPGGLLAFDEPESHLHPNLLMRVLDLCESIAYDRAVLLATHSDRLLDGLSDPARSVVLCELDDNRATVLRRPDRQQLDEWLKDYRGFGDVRSAGYESFVMRQGQKEDGD